MFRLQHRPTKARTRNAFRPGLESCETRQLLATNLLAPALVQPTTGLVGPLPTGPTTLALADAPRLASVLNTKVTPFDLTTRGSLTFDLGTGSYFVKVDVAKGVSYDTDRIKEILSGNVSLPRINPIEALSAFYGLRADHTSDYVAVRQQTYDRCGAENVYLVSLRFSEWASPETVGAELAKAIATAGSSAASSVKEAFNQIKLELNDVYSWVKVKSQAEAPKILANVVQALVLKQDFDSPFMAIKWLNVKHTYHVNASAYGVGGGAAIDSPRLGFAVIWKTTPGAYARALDNFGQLTGGDPTGVDAILKGLLTQPAFQSNPTSAKFLRLATSNPVD
jgi:hypothetical protein